MTPRETDLMEEAPGSVEIAKTKPINCIDSSESGDRRDGSSQGGGNAS